MQHPEDSFVVAMARIIREHHRRDTGLDLLPRYREEAKARQQEAGKVAGKGMPRVAHPITHTGPAREHAAKVVGVAASDCGGGTVGKL